MNLYREVDFETEPCVFVRVHVVQGSQHPNDPTIGLVEVELEDKPEVTALRTRLAELEEENERMLADWAADLDRLEARVAGLEPDAALGKELREMPGSLKLCRRASDSQRPWLCVPIWEDTSLYQMSEYFDTPEAALEAASQAVGQSCWICEDCGKACTPDDGCHCSEYPNAEWPEAAMEAAQKEDP